jgi:hypothetical protein
MDYPPEQFIPLLDAVARAAARGVTAELLSGVEMRPHELSVSLTTADSEPELVLHTHDAHHSHADELIEKREQSGIDRWDYPLPVNCWRDRLILRLSDGGVSHDVTALPAAHAIVFTRWTDDPTVVVPALVRADEFNSALALFNK